MFAGASEKLGGFALEDAEGGGYGSCLWFRREEVDVLGHEDVAEDREVVAEAEGFDHVLDDLFGFWGGEVGEAVVTAEGDEVEVAFVLETLEADGHVVIVWEMGGSGRAFARLPTHDDETVMNGAPEFVGGRKGVVGGTPGFVGGRNDVMNGAPGFV